MSQSLSGGAHTSAAETADVIVVGAGPGGSSVAAYLAMAGLDVLLLEKTHFPREKVCGDGLTPRAVRELVSLGIPLPEDDGWIKNKGLRIIGGGMRLQLDWPDNASFPPYGLVRTRQDFDDILARHAVAQGAQLREGVNVVAPIKGGDGHIVGVEAKEMGPDGRATGQLLSYRAPLVIAADGNSSRLSLAMGREKREDRPMGVAVRAYYTSPRHDDDYLESWLELWSKDAQGKRVLLPGYGWIFGVGDGTSNVGLGILNTSAAFGKTDYRQVMRQWVETMPAEWTYNEETITGPHQGRRAADGLQPSAALRRRAAAGGRRGRHGQPVQRRGHRLCDGVGAVGGRSHRPGVRPHPTTRAGSGCCRATRR